MVKATVNLGLMDQRIETLLKDGDRDAGRIPIRMNMTGVKAREAQMEEEDLSWLKNRIEDPKAMVVVCLRACHYRRDIDQTNILKFNEFSEYMDQLRGFVRTSNLENEGKDIRAGSRRPSEVRRRTATGSGRTAQLHRF
jgi:hypothetical protein